MGVLKDLGRYLTRPIIPFCFGLPLLLPATLLVVVAFLQDEISTTLHVLGFLLLSLSVLSIAWGMALGFHDVCRQSKKRKRPTTKGFQRLGNRKLTPKRRKSPKNSVSPVLFSLPSSESSSRRSSPGSISGNHFVVTNEMIRLVPHAPRKNRRLVGRKANIRPQRTRMPILKEEDQTNPPAENAESAKKDNFYKLEKHLTEIGLGRSVKWDMSQCPVDVEVLPTSKHSAGTVRKMRKEMQSKDHSRSKSLPEEEFLRFMSKADIGDQTVVSGSAMQEEQLRK